MRPPQLQGGSSQESQSSLHSEGSLQPGSLSAATHSPQITAGSLLAGTGASEDPTMGDQAWAVPVHGRWLCGRVTGGRMGWSGSQYCHFLAV